MLIETRLEPHHRRPQPTDRGQDRLAPYVRGLIREEEIANLILALEALSAGDAPDPEMAKGLDALSQVTGLRLDDASAIRDAIVVLGERGEALRQLRREAGSLSLSPLNVRSADGVTEGPNR